MKKDRIEELYWRLKENIVQELSLQTLSDEQVLNTIDTYILKESKRQYLNVKERTELRKQLFNTIRRLDVLQQLIEDEEITEIMINGPNHIFVEKRGRIEPSKLRFESSQRLNDVIQQIVAKANRMVNEANPIVDARLEDGSRVNAVLAPIAMDGSTLTIRKFGKQSMTIEKLIGYGSLTREVAEVLRKLVISKYNIFISGGTGSGKTTFLNALSNYIPIDERIITIEDSAELQIKNIPNLVRLEVRTENVEGKNAISIRDLIKTSLRMRPDRIIVGEVRDEAAIDMLTALNTGHDGSLSTGHANSPMDMLTRLEILVLLGSDIPLLAARKQIASAIDIIIHLGRLRDKSRRVLQIVEVLNVENNEIKVQPLYEFVEKGEDENGNIIGEIVKTQYSMQNVLKLRRAGVEL